MSAKLAERGLCISQKSGGGSCVGSGGVGADGGSGGGGDGGFVGGDSSILHETQLLSDVEGKLLISCLI